MKNFHSCLIARDLKKILLKYATSCWGRQMVDGKVHKVKDEVTRELTKEVKDIVGE